MFYKIHFRRIVSLIVALTFLISVLVMSLIKTKPGRLAGAENWREQNVQQDLRSKTELRHRILSILKRFVKDIQTELTSAQVHQQDTISYLLDDITKNHTVLFLEYAKKLVTQLDKVMFSSNHQSNNTSKEKKRFSCAEEYKGSTFGYPFFRHGFVTTNCTRIPINSSVTVLINSDQSKRSFWKAVTDSIHTHYPGVQVLRLSHTTQNIINEVKSPFVLILPSPVIFDRNIDLERLIRILTQNNLNVFAVGGSVKNKQTGYWNNACHQTTLSNYVYKKVNGYYKSINECLICDYLSGPFLTRTELLRKTGLKDLGQGTFDDWFLRLKLLAGDVRNKAKPIVLSCPDVMFTYNFSTSDVDLRKFTSIWGIQEIIDPNNDVRWYGCNDDDDHQVVKCKFKKGIALPPCCRKELADAITFFMNLCERNNITCELQEGTHLGAIKFEYVLPWERDADVTFLTSDFEKLKSLSPEFHDNDYSLSIESQPWCCVDGIQAGGVFHIRAKSWNLEVYGQHIMDSKELMKKGRKPTKVKFGRSWVQVPENPGQFSRNRYGREIYRHAEHWITSSKSSGWDAYEAGKFEECPEPGHHACLDQFDADGNIQFRQNIP